MSLCMNNLYKADTADQDLYGDDPQQHPDYGRIINKRHWERIMKLIPGLRS